MALKTGSICSKHNEIEDLAKELAEKAGIILDIVGKCLDDGGRMEEGLIEKRKRIEALEGQVEDLKTQLQDAEEMIGSLRDENSDLAAELKAAQSCAGEG